jgi:hypothetical protein
MPLYRKQVINQSAPSSLILPSVVKTTANNNDYFIGIDENSELYKIKKYDLLAGLSSGSGTGGSTTPPTIPVNAITGFDGANQFIIEIGNNNYLTY